MPGLNNLKIAVSCSSNMNRSMEAHASLSKIGFYVKSFGTGEKVKLPGTAPDRPNVYEFGCSYEDIYQDLLAKDKTYYTQNGLLHMLDRNRRIKLGPEKFQTCRETFDIVITCEERVYDQVVEDLESRENQLNIPVHIINIDIQDNHEEATLGAFLVCELVQERCDKMISGRVACLVRQKMRPVNLYYSRIIFQLIKLRIILSLSCR